MPPASEGFYAENSGITDDAITPVNTMISTLGPPDEIGETNCSANSNAGTGENSGQFVSCTGSVTYLTTPAGLNTVLRKEGEDWKLLKFALNVADIEAYGQLVIEPDRAAEEALQE